MCMKRSFVFLSFGPESRNKRSRETAYVFRAADATRYGQGIVVVIRWDEKAGLRRDAVGSQVIDVLEAQEIKETGNEEG
jgi:hypothetical protein